jgi:hypothetical protein
MSLRHEQYRALTSARNFMRELLDPSITKRVPKAVRARAYNVLRHYPMLRENGEPIFSNDSFSDTPTK